VILIADELGHSTTKVIGNLFFLCEWQVASDCCMYVVVMILLSWCHAIESINFILFFATIEVIGCY
jgi:hypothetical protein